MLQFSLVTERSEESYFAFARGHILLEITLVPELSACSHLDVFAFSFSEAIIEGALEGVALPEVEGALSHRKASLEGADEGVFVVVVEQVDLSFSVQVSVEPPAFEQERLVTNVTNYLSVVLAVLSVQTVLLLLQFEIAPISPVSSISPVLSISSISPVTPLPSPPLRRLRLRTSISPLRLVEFLFLILILFEQLLQERHAPVLQDGFLKGLQEVGTLAGGVCGGGAGQVLRVLRGGECGQLRGQT